jgi:DNA repair protein RadC
MIEAKNLNELQVNCLQVALTHLIDQRILFEGALLAHSTAIILSHNHPSGQLFPSESDKAATNNIKAACKIMNFQLLDHIILTESGYYSFADEGLI